MQNISRKELFKNHSYFCYAMSAFLALLSYGMSYIALTWMVLHYTNGGLGSVVILMFCFWLPTVFISPFAGVIVDRFCRRKLFIFTSWSRGLLLLILGILEWRWPSLMGIYIISVLEGIVSCFVMPTVTALIREIVPEEQLLIANATMDMVYECGNVLGMALAGFAIAILSNAGSLVLDGLIFFIATIFAYGIKKLHVNFDKTAENVTGVLSEITQGLRYILKTDGISVVYSLELIALILYMVVPVLTAPFASQYLHASVAEFGYLEAVLSVGVILGNFFAPTLVRHLGLMKVLLLFNALLAISFILFADNRHFGDACLLNFIIGIGFATWPLATTRAQELTDINFQGRVNASFSSLSGVFMLLVYSLLYFDSNFIELYHLYYVQVALVAISTLLILTNRRLFKSTIA